MIHQFIVEKNTFSSIYAKYYLQDKLRPFNASVFQIQDRIWIRMHHRNFKYRKDQDFSGSVYFTISIAIPFGSVMAK